MWAPAARESGQENRFRFRDGAKVSAVVVEGGERESVWTGEEPVNCQLDYEKIVAQISVISVGCCG